MKTVAINLDGVIRDYISRFDFVYRKHFIHNPEAVNGNIPSHAELASGDQIENAFTYNPEISDEEEEKMREEIEKKERLLLNLPVVSDDLTNHYKFFPKEIKMDQSIDGGETIRLTTRNVFEKFLYEEYPFQIFGRAHEYPSAMDYANKIQAFGKMNKLYKTVLFSTVKQSAIPSTFAFLSTFHCRIKNIAFLDSEFDKWDLCDILIDCEPKAIHNKPDDKHIIKINREWNQWDEVKPSYDSLQEVYTDKAIQKIIEGETSQKNLNDSN